MQSSQRSRVVRGNGQPSKLLRSRNARQAGAGASKKGPGSKKLKRTASTATLTRSNQAVKPVNGNLANQWTMKRLHQGGHYNHLFDNGRRNSVDSATSEAFTDSSDAEGSDLDAVEAIEVNDARNRASTGSTTGSSRQSRKRSCTSHTGFRRLRGNTQEILLVGGIEVKKRGFMFVKEEGFGSMWRRRLVTVGGGVMKVFDPVALKAAEKNLDYMNLDDIAESILNLVDLKEIRYEKRKSKSFDLVFGPEGNLVKKKARSLSSLLKSSLTNLSASSDYKVPDLTVHFKLGKGSEADNWMQRVLYEVRNQALFVDEAIKIVMKAKADNTDKLEMLLREAMDLWSLAKGISSKESVDAINRFIAFLEQNMSANEEYEEDAIFWREVIVKKIAQMDDDRRSTKSVSNQLSGLEELQKLNDEKFHRDSKKPDKFHVTRVSVTGKTKLSRKEKILKRVKMPTSNRRRDGTVSKDAKKNSSIVELPVPPVVDKTKSSSLNGMSIRSMRSRDI